MVLERDLNFFGILTNVDDSILNLNLKNNFKFDSMDFEEAVDLITYLEIEGSEQIRSSLINDLKISSSDKIFCVKNSFIIKGERNDLSGFFDFHNDQFVSYLKPTIKKMRLFKDGNIIIPRVYYYLIEDDIPQSLVTPIYQHPIIIKEPYHIENTEKSNLQSFLESNNLPFRKKFLKLAFENFNLSYTIENINLRFLSLMNGIEALFHPSNEGELTYRISRNSAVLLGTDKESSTSIQSEMKKLYLKRSKIVHTGSADVSMDELQYLRNIMRDSIMKIDELNLDKEDLLKLLNSSGFEGL